MSVTINFFQKHVRTLAVKCKHVKKARGKKYRDRKSGTEKLLF